MPDSQKKRNTGPTPDWSDSAELGSHLWSSYSTSEECYLPETHCVRRGNKHRCSVCKIIVHGDCIDIVTTQMKWICRPSFREVDVRSYRDESKNEHHWVQQRHAHGKCAFCLKNLQPKKLFYSKDLVVTTCTWCKKSYHNRDSCFNAEKDLVCTLGFHANIIVPLSWVLKLQNKGDFKSSLRCKKKPMETDKIADEHRNFIIKSIPSASINPVIVFINPKSGGNQGIKLLQKFQWLLNPRQVFDLTQGGPNMGLELFKMVPQLRVLACGGDGTVGWVLSVIDKIGFPISPAVGVLPLGTGNDLGRALGWGGGYTDEPISKILTNIGNSEVIMLDRWKLTVETNPNASNSDDGNDNLPLNVLNNYFSLGVDAQIALEFHQAREAHPEKFNSRIRNKMFYGQRGGKDLLRRKWKALSDYVTLTCDGQDYTSSLKEHKFHAIVFLNIASYGGGTKPWPRTSGCEQSTEDGLIEVVGLTTFQLPLLQAGGHGDKICQCKTARIETTKTIPMQVDGEACKLKPSIITLELLNKAAMLAKRKTGSTSNKNTELASLVINVHFLKMSDYEQYHCDKIQLKEKALDLGELTVSPDTDLEHLRNKLNEIIATSGLNKSMEWCFLDSCTAERCFRIDRAQEHLYYINDIANKDLFILEPIGVSEMETALPSPSSDRDEQSFSENGKSGINNSYITAKEEVITITGESREPVKELCRKIEAAQSERSSGGGPSRLNLIYPGNFVSGKSSKSILDAARDGDLKKLKELHSEGYSLLSENDVGETALHYAAYYGQRDIIKYLITSAPHQIINCAESKQGQTALHKAVLSRYKNICCMLVAAGAYLSATDFNGKTPKELSSDPDITCYLESQEEFVKMENCFENVSV